jgi:putative transposase
MGHHKAFRFRLYPDAAQEALFRKTAGCCRVVYNVALEQRRVFGGPRYVGPNRNFGYNAQRAELKDLKVELPWLREVPHHCIQEALVDLDVAFQKFFKGESGYPRFRSKHRRDSFRFPDPLQFNVAAMEIMPARQHDRRDALTGEPPVRFGHVGVALPKAGLVPWVLHRGIVGTPKSITVSRQADAWYASVLCELPDALPEPKPLADELVVKAADLGAAKSVATSDGAHLDLPKTSPRRAERKRRLQRKMARRKRGSKNREKARRSLARFEGHGARRRKDAAHKTARHLLCDCDVLVFEALKIKNMTASAAGAVEEPGVNVAQKSGLNRSMLDVAWGQLRRTSEWQAAKLGKRVLTVSSAHSSQDCPACDHRAAANRPSRDLFLCERCAYRGHADDVAALNLKGRGKRRLRELAHAALRPEPAGASPVRRRTFGGSPRRAPRPAPLGSGKMMKSGDAVFSD